MQQYQILPQLVLVGTDIIGMYVRDVADERERGALNKTISSDDKKSYTGVAK